MGKINQPTEQTYIHKRKRKAFIESLLYYFFRIFPVQRNKITVCAFEGKSGFCCNPRYIVEELNRRNKGYHFVWLVNDLSKQFPVYVRPVKNTLWNRAYHLTTSKVWIDNYRKPYGTKKRKGQYYLQTWHGALAFKTLGLWRGEGFSKIAYLVSKSDADMTDYVICDSEWGRQVYPKGLVYDGDYLKYGSARCDILVNSREQQYVKIRETYHLPKDAKIVMFAPTFRETGQKGQRGVFVEENTLDFARMMKNLGKRFSGEWYLFLRLHPQLAAQMEKYPLEGLEGRTVDVSQADDMCEVMAAVDVLITDYSSAAMDAGFVNIPVFLYADDIMEYTENRGGMFWTFPEAGSGPIVNNKAITPDIEAILPYPLARNNEELERNIIGFNIEKYMIDIKKFAEAIDLVNDGKASERAADQVEGWMR